MKLPFFTVGHSTRSIGEFVELLEAAGVAFLVDVRRLPGSRSYPQFNADALAEVLAQVGIGYRHLTALGGRRRRDRDVPPELNGFWQNRSFHNYADYALSGEFQTGLDELLALGRVQRCAIMCSEAVWWRCHRRIVADWLLARGEAVFHLMGEERIEPAHLNAGAVVRPDMSVVYPAGA